MAAHTLTRAPLRLRLSFGLLLVVGVLLAARLFYWQILQGDRMRALADQQAIADTVIPAERGEIQAADGTPLAVDVPVVTIRAWTKGISDPGQLSTELAPILGQPREAILSKLQSQDSSVTLVRDAPAQVGDRVQDLKTRLEVQQPRLGLASVTVEITNTREYPLRAFAAPVIGYVNKQRVAATGIEQYFDTELRGTNGKVHGEVDALRDLIPVNPPAREPAIDGSTVVLTIDPAMQRIAEAELANALRDSRAASGCIIVMDPKTGAILAMAVAPTADLNDFAANANTNRYLNTAVMSEYEPGSVFKIVTVAAGLDARTISPATGFDDDGKLLFGGVTTYNHDHIAPGHVSLLQVLQMSLNVEAAKIAIGLGPDRFYEYVRGFGFGKNTGVELAGETPGLVKTPGDGKWHDSDLAANGYGQAISATPLQMIAAVAAVANQGNLMRPYIVKQVQPVTGDPRITLPVTVRQVIRPETARTLTQLLSDSIAVESTNKANVPGYKVAGKTGTAQIAVFGGYDPKWTIASFAGYLPADDPRFVILVKLDKPQSSEWGSQVASPVFATVAKQLVTLIGLPPDGVRQGK